MKKKLLTIVMICMLVVSLSACEQRTSNQQPNNTEKTKSKEETSAVVSTDKAEGKKRMKGFSAREISDDLFERIKGGNTYKEECIVPREDLRYLTILHKDKEGNTHQGRNGSA